MYFIASILCISLLLNDRFKHLIIKRMIIIVNYVSAHRIKGALNFFCKLFKAFVCDVVLTHLSFLPPFY